MASDLHQAGDRSRGRSPGSETPAETVRDTGLEVQVDPHPRQRASRRPARQPRPRPHKQSPGPPRLHQRERDRAPRLGGRIVWWSTHNSRHGWTSSCSSSAMSLACRPPSGTHRPRGRPPVVPRGLVHGFDDPARGHQHPAGHRPTRPEARPARCTTRQTPPPERPLPSRRPSRFPLSWAVRPVSADTATGECPERNLRRWAGSALAACVLDEFDRRRGEWRHGVDRSPSRRNIRPSRGSWVKGTALRLSLTQANFCHHVAGGRGCHEEACP